MKPDKREDSVKRRQHPAMKRRRDQTRRFRSYELKFKKVVLALDKLMNRNKTED
jgi:hypothetical protein